MDLFTRQVTEHLDQGVSKYVITTAAAADEVADEDRGPGSGLTGDQAHPSYCPMCTRRALAVKASLCTKAQGAPLLFAKGEPQPSNISPA